MGVNKQALMLEIYSQSDKIFKDVKPILKKKFDSVKKNALKKFDNDPVTEELKEGPEASSSFVKTIAGGNLYSLLGFESGEDPTEILREILENQIKLQIQNTTKTLSGNKIIWNVRIDVPSASEIHDEVASESPLEWTSKAWTQLLEEGIPWFAHYLFKEGGIKASHSGTAIEVKGTIREGRSGLPKIKYISKILKYIKDLK